MKTPTVFILDGRPDSGQGATARSTDAVLPRVSGKPFLEWQLEWLVRRGFRTIVFISNRKYSDLPDHRSVRPAGDISFRCCSFRELAENGTDAARSATVGSEGECLFVEGNVLFDIPLDWLAQYRCGSLPEGSVCAALKYSGNAEGSRRFSVDPARAVSRYHDNSDIGSEGYVYGGIFASDARLLRDIGRLCPSSGDALFPGLIGENRLFGIPFGGKYIDIGQEDLGHAPVPSLRDWVVQKKSPALFLDRDGILVEDSGYVKDPDTLVFKKSFFNLSRMAQDKGFLIVVLSNQAGVAKGVITVGDVERVNGRIREEFERYGVRPSAMYWCPYHEKGMIPEWTRFSLLRKPEPAMALKAMEEHPIDPLKSLMIGDKNTDRIRLPYLRTFIVPGRYPVDDPGDVVDIRHIEEIIRAY